MMADESRTLSLREVADKAGVRPSAVSNWRKRNVGFPPPVASSGREELFDAAQVEAWLRATGRLEVDSSGQVRPRLSREEQEQRARIGMALVALYRVLSPHQRQVLLAAEPGSLLRRSGDFALELEQNGAVPPAAFTASLDPGADPDRLRLPELLAEVAAASDHGVEVFESLAQVHADIGGGHLGLRRSHALLGVLMNRLLPPQASAVHDPALGEAGLLSACAEGRPDVQLSGTEIDVAAFVVAAQRLLAHGHRPDLRLGDSLHADPFSGETFDAVVCEPPVGQKSTTPDELALTYPGVLGASADLQWVVHSLLKVRPGGLALVAQPAGVLNREGNEAAVRAELLRGGNVLAVIALPAGMSEASSSPMAVWVLAGGRQKSRRDEVLFVDISWAPARTGAEQASLASEILPDVIADFRRWLEDAEGFDGRAGMSAAIPVLDLLGANTPLSPQYWVGRADRLRSRDVWSATRDDAWASVDLALVGLAGLEPPEADLNEFMMDEPPRYIPLATLVEAGRLDLQRGEPLDKKELGPSGFPVLTASSLADPRQPLQPSGHVRDPLRCVTRPGDVVFLPRGRAIRAVVDHDGGHHVAAPLLVLRPAEGDRGMVADLLAALLSSPRVQTLGSGTTVQSVTPRSLTLPHLPAATAAAAGSYLQFLQGVEAAAVDLLEGIERAREALVEGLETGARLAKEAE